MGLLDELKKRAAEKEAQRSANIEDDARADEIRAVALPALFRIHANLAELVKQLRILDEETPVSLKIPGLGEVSGFQQRDYSVSAEGTPPPQCDPALRSAAGQSAAAGNDHRRHLAHHLG